MKYNKENKFHYVCTFRKSDSMYIHRLYFFNEIVFELETDDNLFSKDLWRSLIMDIIELIETGQSVEELVYKPERNIVRVRDIINIQLTNSIPDKFLKYFKHEI